MDHRADLEQFTKEELADIIADEQANVRELESELAEVRDLARFAKKHYQMNIPNLMFDCLNAIILRKKGGGDGSTK